jgi:hypothetical protein
MNTDLDIRTLIEQGLGTGYIKQHMQSQSKLNSNDWGDLK